MNDLLGGHEEAREGATSWSQPQRSGVYQKGHGGEPPKRRASHSSLKYQAAGQQRVRSSATPATPGVRRPAVQLRQTSASESREMQKALLMKSMKYYITDMIFTQYGTDIHRLCHRIDGRCGKGGATKATMLRCVSIIGPRNEPVFFRRFLQGEAGGAEDGPELRYHFTCHSALDVLDERNRGSNKTPDMFLGLLCFMEEFQIYAYLTNSQLKILAVLEDAEIVAEEGTRRKEKIRALLVQYISVSRNLPRGCHSDAVHTRRDPETRDESLLEAG
eukprot:scaffold7340_cov266-Pinguiococcus_pyrenoidosus.AAC.53